MEKLAVTEVLRKIALGDIDLDEITEVLRSSELVIKSYRNETEELRRTEEQLRQEFEAERQAADDLTHRLAVLHEENQLAKEVFLAEIEGRRQILGIATSVDLEALNMVGLIHEREALQRQVGATLGQSGAITINR